MLEDPDWGSVWTRIPITLLPGTTGPTQSLSVAPQSSLCSTARGEIFPWNRWNPWWGWWGQGGPGASLPGRKGLHSMACGAKLFAAQSCGRLEPSISLPCFNFLHSPKFLSTPSLFPGLSRRRRGPLDSYGRWVLKGPHWPATPLTAVLSTENSTKVRKMACWILKQLWIHPGGTVKTKCDRSYGEGHLHTHTLWKEPAIAVTPFWDSSTTPPVFPGKWSRRSQNRRPLPVYALPSHSFMLFLFFYLLFNLLTWRPSRSDPQQFWLKSKPKHDCTTKLCHLILHTSLLSHLRKPLQGPISQAHPAEGTLPCPAHVLWSSVHLPLSAKYRPFDCKHVLGKWHHSTGGGRAGGKFQLTLGHELKFPSGQGP